MSHPVLNSFISPNVFKAFPESLHFYGYFVAHLTESELRALKIRCAGFEKPIVICDPEDKQPGAGGPDRRLRMVMDFRKNGLSGGEIFGLMEAFRYWMLII